MVVEVGTAYGPRVAPVWIFVNGTDDVEDCGHEAGTEDTLGACQACHQGHRTEACRREDNSLEGGSRTASLRPDPFRQGEVRAWSCDGRVCLRGPRVGHVDRSSRWAVHRQREARRRGWGLLARTGSHCIRTGRAAQHHRRVRAGRARGADRLERDCSAGRTSCWAHSHSGWVAEEREPTGREGGVEKAPAEEGHRGSRRGCPDFPSGRTEAFVAAASTRVLARVCCWTCGVALRGRVCGAQTCGGRLVRVEREARAQGQCGGA